MASLVGPLSRLNLGSGQGSAAAANNNTAVYSIPNGTKLTVRHLTAEEEANIGHILDRRIAAKQAINEANKEIADSRAVEKAALAEVARLQEEKAAATAHLKVTLDKIAAALQGMKPQAQNNPVALQRIETLRQKVLTFKANLPETGAEQTKVLLQLKSEYAAIQQSLKKP